MDIGGRQLNRERDPLAVDHKVVLRARFALIRRIRPGCLAPLFAGTDALSRLARLQSIRSASPSRSGKTWCKRSQTPACCQSRSRRQQVTPLLQPISKGNISQGMPLFKPKMMLVRAARFGTRGRPPFGLGGSGGSSGSMMVHSSSRTNGLLMPLGYQTPAMVLKGTLRAF